MKISVVVPAYNEEQNLGSLIEELLPILKNNADINDYEIIIVDDHSTDDTFAAAVKTGDRRIKCLRLSKRSGSHIALRAGIREADGDTVLCISADGQDDPNCLKDMLARWRAGAKVVWGLKKSRKGEPWHIRKPAQLFFRFLAWFGGSGGTGIDISRANFFLLDKMAVQAINECRERNTSLFGLIMWLGFKQDFVEYNRRPRRFGRSKWNFQSQLRLARDWIIAFTGLPISLILPIGVIVTAAGFIYALLLFISSLQGRIIEGWSVIIALILLIGGIQIIILSIIGEYLWHSVVENRKRPLFFIERRSDNH